MKFSEKQIDLNSFYDIKHKVTSVSCFIFESIKKFVKLGLEMSVEEHQNLGSIINLDIIKIKDDDKVLFRFDSYWNFK